jgi:hypothetical protein
MQLILVKGLSRKKESNSKEKKYTPIITKLRIKCGQQSQATLPSPLPKDERRRRPGGNCLLPSALPPARILCPTDNLPIRRNYGHRRAATK